MSGEKADGVVRFSDGKTPLLDQRDRAACGERRDSARRSDLKWEIDGEAGDAAIAERPPDRGHHLFLARPEPV